MLIMIDLDNTLADRARAVDEWAVDFAAERGLGSDDVQWIKTLDNDGYSNRVDVFASLADRFQLTEPVEELLLAYQARIVDLTRPVPGALACLAEMRAMSWQIALVTNGSTKQQNAKIDHLGFRSMVDGVVVSETLGIKKPDSGIFKHAAALCGVDLATAGAGNCWMVGDSPLHDIEGAQALGISTAWIPRGRAWPAGTTTPTVIADDLAGLPTQFVAAR